MAAGTREFELTTVQLQSADRLVLITDGITEREVDGGGVFGVEGLRRAVRDSASATAAATAMAIQQAVTSSWTEPLADDATLVVLAVD